MLISSKYFLDLPDASLLAVRSSTRRATESVSDHLRKKSAEGAGWYRRGERQGHEPLGVSVFVLSPRLEQQAEENRADAHERAVLHFQFAGLVGGIKTADQRAKGTKQQARNQPIGAAPVLGHRVLGGFALAAEIFYHKERVVDRRERNRRDRVDHHSGKNWPKLNSGKKSGGFDR